MARTQKEENVEKTEVVDLEELKAIIEKNPDYIKEHPEIITQIEQSIEFTEIRKSHSGPIPDAETLKEYKQVYKDAPEIIFSMATKEQSFRHFSTYLGQFSALLIGLSGLGVTAYLGAHDQPWLAGVIGFGSLSSLVGVFLYKKKK
ncbi:MAG: hypothetical protein U9O64_05415 [Campylobacterota bacterium]|nr:hypothetical protein [Campylobacterota bacterium]